MLNEANLGSETEEVRSQPEHEDRAPALSIEHVQLAQEFINKIKLATLDNGKLDAERLHHPTEDIIDLSDPNLRFVEKTAGCY